MASERIIGLAHEVWAMAQGPRDIEDAADAIADIIERELFGKQEPVGWTSKSMPLACTMSARAAKTVWQDDAVPLYRHPWPIPAGWVLVPEDLADSVREIMVGCETGELDHTVESAWAAMIDAAPTYTPEES